MSRNRLPPSVNPPEESESEEDEEDEEGVEEEEQVEVNRKEAGSDEEEEEEHLSAKTTSQVRGLDYGSDGDSGKTIPPPSVSDFVVEQNSKIEKDKEPKKRLAESGDASRDKSQVKKAKREKKTGNGAEKDVAVEDKSKRSAGGQRIWCAEDELKILKGMLDYKDKTGVDFNSNLEAFYKYIKGSLNAVVDKNQLKNKIRKLKDKYCNNALKEANGKAPVFSQGHEDEAYEYSKKIWGGKSVSQGAKSKPTAKKEVSVAPSATDNVLALPVPDKKKVITLSVPDKKKVISGSAKVASRARNRKVSRKMDLDGTDVEMKDCIISMPAMEDNFMVKKGLELAEKSKVDALNQKWTKYQLELAQLYAKKLDLVMEHTKLILHALKSNP